MRERKDTAWRLRAALMRQLDRRWVSWLLAGLGLALIAVLLSACGSGGGEAKAISGKLPADIEISAYQGADLLGGDVVALSELLEGGTPVVLNMWAGLCPTCRLEMPHLEAAHRAYGDQVQIIGLDIGPFVGLGDKEDALKLLGDMGVTYPAGATDDAGVVKAYQVLGTPSLFFIAPDGEIVQRWAGMMAEDRLMESIEKLLAASSVNGG
jgi:thiol-disulfide isomerase/thioredoxin